MRFGWMMPDRRQVLRSTGVALAGTALAGRGAAAESYSYAFTGQAIAPNPTEVKVDGSVAYAATGDSVTAVDVSDPRFPVLVDRARAPKAFWEDLKIGGSDGNVVSLSQDDSDPGGIVLFDATDPTSLRRGRLYRTGVGIHNHFVDDRRDVAYLCVNSPFTNPRMVIVDVTKGLADASTVDIPITRENVSNDDPVSAIFRLADVNPAMAEAGLNVCHDIYVERRGTREVAHVCFWDAGMVVVDVTDPTDPFAVAHFGAVEDADVAPRSTAEFFSRYVGMPGNAHYSKPTPNGDYLFVGAEAYPDPTGTAIPEEHGDIRVFDLSSMNLRSPLNTDTPTYDPTAPAPVEVIENPKEPRYGALRTSHNFDFTTDGTRFYSTWYQGGVRAYDVTDPTAVKELAAWIDPNGNAFWGAQALRGEATTLGNDRRFTIASDRNAEGLLVLELTTGGSGSTLSTPTRVDETATPAFMHGAVDPSAADLAIDG